MNQLIYDSDDDGQVAVALKKLSKKQPKPSLAPIEEDSDSDFELAEDISARKNHKVFLMYDSDHEDTILEEPITDSPSEVNRHMYDSDDDGQLQKVLDKMNKAKQKN